MKSPITWNVLSEKIHELPEKATVTVKGHSYAITLKIGIDGEVQISCFPNLENFIQ